MRNGCLSERWRKLSQLSCFTLRDCQLSYKYSRPASEQFIAAFVGANTPPGLLVASASRNVICRMLPSETYQTVHQSKFFSRSLQAMHLGHCVPQLRWSRNISGHGTGQNAQAWPRSLAGQAQQAYGTVKFRPQELDGRYLGITTAARNAQRVEASRDASTSGPGIAADSRRDPSRSSSVAGGLPGRRTTGRASSIPAHISQEQGDLHDAGARDQHARNARPLTTRAHQRQHVAVLWRGAIDKQQQAQGITQASSPQQQQQPAYGQPHQRAELPSLPPEQVDGTDKVVQRHPTDSEPASTVAGAQDRQPNLSSPSQIGGAGLGQDAPNQRFNDGNFVEGTISSVLFHNSDTGYGIVKVKSDQVGGCPEAPGISTPTDSSPSGTLSLADAPRLFVVKGSVLGNLTKGLRVRFHGHWGYHKQFGLELNATRFTELELQSEPDLIDYIANANLPGIGQKKAGVIVKGLGLSTIDILNSSDAVEKLKGCHGIGTATALKIKSAWDTNAVHRKIHEFLKGLGIPQSLVPKLWRSYNTNTEEMMRKDPYTALRRAGGKFEQAEHVVSELRLEHCHTMDSRAQLALSSALHRITQSEGHTHCTWHVLRVAAQELLCTMQDSPWWQETELMRIAEQLRVKGHIVAEPPIVQNGSNAAASKAMAKWLQSSERPVFQDDDEHLPPLDWHHDTCVYTARMYEAEVGCACLLARLAAQKVSAESSSEEDRAKVLQWIDKNEAATGRKLSEGQREALVQATRLPVLILTGGPGCGKTVATADIVKLWKTRGVHLALAAPTGRAAQRLQETCGEQHVQAMTIHRLLEYRGRPDEELDDQNKLKRLIGAFGRDDQTPLEARALLVDETSMVDIALALSFLKALPVGGCNGFKQLVLVGDPDQLPPVGPGTILDAAIKSGMFPIVDLREVFRQAKESAIVTSAHAILEGRLPNLTPDRFHLQKQVDQSPACAAARVADWLDKQAVWLPAAHYDPKDTLVGTVLHALASLQNGQLDGAPIQISRDVQVIAPTRKGAVGVSHLNKLLQKVLNPPDPAKPEMKVGTDTLMRLTDRVMQTVNNYEYEVFNGDSGFVTAVDSKRKEITVSYPLAVRAEDAAPKCVEYLGERLHEIDLAWATTVHKAQGGEWPIVVVMLSRMHGRMLNRRLLYTALTRAKNLVLVVGSKESIQTAVQQKDGDTPRLTQLPARMRLAAHSMGLAPVQPQRFPPHGPPPSNLTPSY